MSNLSFYFSPISCNSFFWVGDCDAFNIICILHARDVKRICDSHISDNLASILYILTNISWKPVILHYTKKTNFISVNVAILLKQLLVLVLWAGDCKNSAIVQTAVSGDSWHRVETICKNQELTIFFLGSILYFSIVQICNQWFKTYFCS